MRARALFRIRCITVIVAVLALVLLGRLYQLQVHQHSGYREQAERQYVHTVRDFYNRGSIYFQTKAGERVSAATIQSGYVLAVNPNRIVDAEEAYKKLSTVYETNREQFIDRATKPERTYVEIDPKVSNETATAIAELDLPGVELYRNQWRYYPGNELAARTVGFVGFSAADGTTLSGRYGLERYYDDVLRREDERLSVNFFAEIFSNLGKIIFENTDERTGDIVTTIEPTVARMLEQQLMATHEKWDSKLTGGIIIDPVTGEIVAMSAVPSFDANDRTGATIEDFQNPLVENVYEMGSIVKALTIAAGIDFGAIRPETTYYDSGKLELDTFTIGNYDGRGRGTVDMQEVLNQSLNTGVAFVADRMGKDAFRKYFMALKLGSETGIDLPNESFGLVSNLNSPRDIEYATASFGQGIALTPIAITRALSALANGGKLITPHLVQQVEYENGEVKEVLMPPGERVFSVETSEEISRMLTIVVDDALAGGARSLPNHSVAAKTGTAQISDSVNGGYYEDKFLHSFFGYFPSYDPEYLIFLYTVEPKQVRYASETLTDPFMELTKFLINYYNIPPDR